MPVYRRKDTGNWIIRFYWPDGSRFQKTVQLADYPRKRDVQALERSIREAGKTDQQRELRFGQLAAKYWKEHASGLSWSRTIQQHLDLISDAIGDDTPISKISTSTIARAVTYWRETPVYNRARGKVVMDRKTGKPKLPTPATINRRLAVLRGAFLRARDLWEWEVPTIAWKKLTLKEGETIERNLGPADQARLLACCPPWLADIVEFALATGLRQGPILALTWDKVDLDSKMIVPVGKGSKSNPVELTDWAIDILYRIGPRDVGPVFTRNGEIIRSIKGIWERSRAEAGLPDVRFHDLRHTFGQALMDETGNLSLVQDALHHASITTTRRYAHRRRSHIREAANRAQKRRSEEF